MLRPTDLGSTNDFALSAAKDSNGYVVAGGQKGSELAFVKYNPATRGIVSQGVTTFGHTIGSSSGLAIDEFDNITLVGEVGDYNYQTEQGLYDIAIAQFDGNGSPEDMSTINVHDRDFGYVAAVQPQGIVFGALVAGPGAAQGILGRIGRASLVVNSTGIAPAVAGQVTPFTGNLNAVGAREVTLRSAIQYANALPGNQIIRFNIPAVYANNGVWTINEANLPSLTALGGIIDIDARTQPSYVNAPVVTLSGAGLHFQAGNSSLEGLSVTGFGANANGVWFDGTNGCSTTTCVIDGGNALNTIGLYLDNADNGAYTLLTITGCKTAGVLVEDGGTVNTINNSSISANTIGIEIKGQGTDGNNVDNNEIFDNTGSGVYIHDVAQNNKIGDNVGNSIHDNLDGIEIKDVNTRDNHVSNNTISLNTVDGVEIFGGANFNYIGNFGRNWISYSQDGVEIWGTGSSSNDVAQNDIMLNTNDGVNIHDGAQYNRIGNAVGNEIFSNGNNGIEVSGAGTDHNKAAKNDIWQNPTGVYIHDDLHGTLIGDATLGYPAQNDIHDNDFGLIITNSGYNEVKYNYITDNTTLGLEIFGATSTENSVTFDHITENGEGVYISFLASSNNIDDCQITGSTTGNGVTINLGAHHNGLHRDVIGQLNGPNAGYGVELTPGSDHTTIYGCTIASNGLDGILINASLNTLVHNSTISSNGNNGIRVIDINTRAPLATGDKNTIEGCTINDNAADGVSIENSQKVYVDSTTVGATGAGNAFNGVHIWTGPANDINIVGPSHDNYVQNRCWISAHSNGFGVLIEGDGSNNNHVVDQNIIGLPGSFGGSPNQDGVVIQNGPQWNEVAGNCISGNKDNGVWIRNASNNTISGNSIGLDDEGHGPVLDGGADWQKDGVLIEAGAQSNTLYGNHISWNKDNNVEITGEDTNCNSVGIDSTNSTNFNLIGLEGLAGGNRGVYVHDLAQHTTIQHNVISRNETGISIANAFDTTIVYNNVGTDVSGTLAAANGTGILIAAPLVDIEHNVISGNSEVGIKFDGVDGGTNGADVVFTLNLVGTRADEAMTLPNTVGVSITNGSTRIHIDDNTITGNTEAGVSISGASPANIIENNRIGTHSAGLMQLGSGNGVGVSISGGSTYNTVTGNTISGNVIGVSISGASGNTVEDNKIGTDKFGVYAIGNETGVQLAVGAQNNTVDNNTISGNTTAGNDGIGVSIMGTNTTGNAILSNYIGVNATASSALPNDYGVWIGQSAHDNSVQTDNVINANNYVGVVIDSGAWGNVIGSNGDGVNDGAEFNLISGNGGDGVWISGAGTTLNRVAGNLIGTSANGLGSVGNGGDGVRIDGGAIANSVGLSAYGAEWDGFEQNIISGNAGNGVRISGTGTSGNVVAGNKIGTTIAGDASLANGMDGVQIDNGASGNFIGTNSDGLRDGEEYNVISGNVGNGVQISGANGNTVAGNRIGTNVDGDDAVGNGGDGVVIDTGSTGNVIGTNNDDQSDSVEGNVISGNTGSGVRISGSGTDSNIVAGNKIGVGLNGSTAIGNLEYGVKIEDDASSNLIGGVDWGNIIANNGSSLEADGHGVYVESGQYNTIRGNSTYSNAGLGIRLGEGANNDQAFPELIGVSTWRLACDVHATYTFDFYWNTSADPSGYGEGRTYLGQSTLTDTDDDGYIVFSYGHSRSITHVTVTATDVLGNTSEFSLATT